MLQNSRRDNIDEVISITEIILCKEDLIKKRPEVDDLKNTA